MNNTIIKHLNRIPMERHMSDWQIGDLALAIGPYDSTRSAKGGPKRGSVTRVDGVVRNPSWPCVGLCFGGYRSPHSSGSWDDRCFSKIRPDEHDACEPEFVALMNGMHREAQLENERRTVSGVEESHG